MFVVCINSKYGFCYYGRKCDKIHFSEICEVRNCLGLKCDKRHPIVCHYFRKYGRCKFGLFCSYKHNNIKNNSSERQLEKEVDELRDEITVLKLNVKELTERLDKFESSVRDKPSTSENVEQPITENTYAENPIEEKSYGKTPVEVACWEPLINVSLQTIIRENSWLLCEKCDYKTKSKKDLRIHVVRIHSEVTGLKSRLVYKICTDQKENQVITCHICGFDMPGIRGSSALGSELVTHFTTKHKEEFDGGVIKWEGLHIVWKNSL